MKNVGPKGRGGGTDNGAETAAKCTFLLILWAFFFLLEWSLKNDQRPVSQSQKKAGKLPLSIIMSTLVSVCPILSL